MNSGRSLRKYQIRSTKIISSTMKTISESPITTLQIIKPDLIKKYYEIKSGEELYGSVDITHNTGTLARIET